MRGSQNYSFSPACNVQRPTHWPMFFFLFVSPFSFQYIKRIQYHLITSKKLDFVTFLIYGTLNEVHVIREY